MSLRGFHIVFVTVSTLLCMFMAVWAFILTPESSGMVTILGYIGAVGALLMPAYGVYFYRKASKLIV